MKEHRYAQRKEKRERENERKGIKDRGRRKE